MFFKLTEFLKDGKNLRNLKLIKQLRNRATFCRELIFITPKSLSFKVLVRTVRSTFWYNLRNLHFKSSDSNVLLENYTKYETKKSAKKWRISIASFNGAWPYVFLISLEQDYTTYEAQNFVPQFLCVIKTLFEWVKRKNIYQFWLLNMTLNFFLPIWVVRP